MHFPIFLLSLCLAVSLGQDFQMPPSWQTLPGQYKDVSAKGDSLWALTQTGQVVQWVGNEWVTTKRDASRIAATSNGGVFLLNGNSIKYHGTSTYWASKTSFGTGINYINAFLSDPVKLVGIGRTDTGSIVPQSRISNPNGNGCIQQWDTDQQALVPRDLNDCNNYKVAIGENDEQWKINNNGSLFHWQDNAWNLESGYGASDSMTFAPTTPIVVDLDVQSKNRVVILTADGNPRLFNGTTWSAVADYSMMMMGSSNNRFVRVTVNNKAVFGLDEFGILHQINV